MVKLNILVDASAKACAICRAEHYVQTLGPLATPESYGGLLSAYAAGSRADAAVRCLRRMAEPSVACYGAALSACGRAGDVPRALGLLRQARGRRGVERDE